MIIFGSHQCNIGNRQDHQGICYRVGKPGLDLKNERIPQYQFIVEENKSTKEAEKEHREMGSCSLRILGVSLSKREGLAESKLAERDAGRWGWK